ncbi:MAG: YicC family protein [Acidobacteria bacterium]|nr:YicC family protein [Acidobacteriota bacterium]
MIKSMTGFASLTREHDLATIGVTVRAVNHRYLDLQVRVPPVVGESEAAIRSQVQRHLARGRVEIGLSIQLRGPGAVDVDLNESLVNALGSALNRAREAGLVTGGLTAGDLLRFPQALAFRERPAVLEEPDQAHLRELITQAVEQVLEDLDAMRAREGGYLRSDLEARRAILGELMAEIESAATEGAANLRVRLDARVSELALDARIEPTLIAQEIVRVVSRSDISEETARFKAHLDHWTTLTDSREPCGRKLDFLLQEMNREVNTIGAKAEGVRVSALIVATKAELEKMREQVQNVE